MSRVILVGHGKLALEMKNSAEMIFGKMDKFSAIEFKMEEGLESLSKKIHEEISAFNREDTLILTDLFCGTPYNAGCAICMKEPSINIEVISGMSLPLVLEAATLLNNTPINEISNILIEYASEMVKSFENQIVEEEEL
ncbi:mannose/fructose/sorbose PTS transporter subunit IIA [Niallia sp.]|uniref:PTS sugar transporter subunit IIA n=1 Tax=Niallia sp. TaxID=2837523 RepID=UPI0028A29CB8|nr:mannose/fructose/sorbose PTS transporter subunit IIA [Niallia sp.]